MSEPESEEPEGTFAAAPYDWRKPTVSRAKSRLWNPDDPRFFPPKSFGRGYTVNFYRVTHPFARRG